MNLERKKTLAQKAMTSSWWHWLPGMRELEGSLCVDTHEGKPYYWFYGDRELSEAEDGEECYPDFDHAGTLGLLREVVRFAYKDPTLNTELSLQGWRIRLTDGTYLGIEDTEAEVLVAVLLMLPE